VEQQIDLHFGSLNVMLNPQTLFSILRFANVNIVDQMKAHNLTPVEDTSTAQLTPAQAPATQAVRLSRLAGPVPKWVAHYCVNRWEVA
jgi:hypothetical protein